MSRSWRGGSTYRWRELRRAILEANRLTNRGLCVLNVGRFCPRHGRPCGRICTRVATQVHHARGKGAGDDPRYLEPTCRACNLHVGQPSAPTPAPTPRSKW